MGTKRKSKGSIAERDGRRYAVNTLADGTRFWTRIPDDGAPLSEDDAREFSRRLQIKIDGGYDPRVKLAEPAPRAIGFYDYVVAFCARQTYESAARELRAVKRYLADCPIAAVAVTALRPRHALALVEHLKRIPSERGGTLGSSMVITTFNVAARALDVAPIDELLASNPLRLEAVVAKLPAKVDKVAGARATWRFTLPEIHLVTTVASIPEDWRVSYAIDAWGGGRPNERRALRIRDVDFDARPMPRLMVPRAIKSDSGAVGSTKTGATKEIPMLPPLVAVLRAWIDHGWERAMGRKPRPDDLLVPSVRGRCKGSPRNQSAANRTFQQHQTAVGIAEPRHAYALRHSFIRLLRDAGAVREITKWATHAPPSSTLDNYASAPGWPVMCAEFAKVLPFLGEPIVDAIVDVGANTPANSNGSTAESKRSASPVAPQNPASIEDSAEGDSVAPPPLSLTRSTLSGPLSAPEAGRRCEAALWAWADAALAWRLDGQTERGHA